MRIAGGRCTGFTLIEVMVALAIMVILFALLFAPMIAGLEWVSSGRANVGMQDACRYAMEQIRR
ncbi:MAG: prepilin-type N-terminal cleavage/methylation domain-containing protein, partial [Armatimonadetes bacterium]|nr:prepilin-type N-terminal cleavage/methylation domain-containing protein [Armatimonadota bacterium]